MKVNLLSLKVVRSIVLAVILCAAMQVEAQRLIGGSLPYQESERSSIDSRIWLEYANHFSFKKGMSIDSDFGHQFYTDSEKKRLSIRSVFLYDLTHNLKVGGGMGFFWYYDTPVLSQELRFIQQVSHSNDFGSSILKQRLLFEEQITQNIGVDDDYKTRLRYQIGLEIPSNNALYFGVSDEIFANLSDNGESHMSMINKNRFATYMGYNTYQRFRIEARILMEDKVSRHAGVSAKSWVFILSVRQTI